MRIRIFFFTLVLTAVVISCNSKKAQSIQTQQLDITEPFDISYSEGGGITGQVDSYHLASTGLVEHFIKMPGRSDSLIWRKNISEEELARLQHALTASSILNETLKTRGNMTSSLTYATADTSYNFSWAGVGAMSEVSPDMKKWLVQLKALLQLNE